MVNWNSCHRRFQWRVGGSGGALPGPHRRRRCRGREGRRRGRTPLLLPDPNPMPRSLPSQTLPTSGLGDLERGPAMRFTWGTSSRAWCAREQEGRARRSGFPARRLTWRRGWGAAVPFPTSPKPATTGLRHPSVRRWPPCRGRAGARRNLRSAAPARPAPLPSNRLAGFNRTRELRAGARSPAEHCACPGREFSWRLLPAGNASSSRRRVAQSGWEGARNCEAVPPTGAYDGASG